MTQKIYINKTAPQVIPSHVKPKTVTKHNRTYTRVDTYTKSRCLSAVKAISLSALAIFIFPVAIKKFRASLKENWLATGKEDKCQIDKYMLKPSEAKKPTSTQSAKKAQKKDQDGLSQEDTLRMVYNGIILPSSQTRMTISELETMRKKFLNFSMDRAYQKAKYEIDDVNHAVFEFNVLNGNKKQIKQLDQFSLQATLRYMLLKGDIVLYRRSKRGFRAALNQAGIKTMSFEGYDDERPITRKLLRQIDHCLQQFHIPPMPNEFKGETTKVALWNAALTEIKQELYNRNLRLPEENRAVILHASQGKSPSHRDIFNHLVKLKVITSWNISSDTLTARFKIGEDDVIENLRYLFTTWQDTTTFFGSY